MKIIAGIDYSLTCPAICVFASYNDTDDFKFGGCSFYYLTEIKRHATTYRSNIFGQGFIDWDTQEQRYESIADWAEEKYPELKNWFTERNSGEELIHQGASSRKLKIQTKMVQIVKASLKEHDTKAYDMFITAMESATGVTTQKRFYMSEYGYSNTKDVLLGKTDTLTKAEIYDRFELENITKWWKKLATKRFNNIVADGRIRKELEVWNKDTMNKIDIIR